MLFFLFQVALSAIVCFFGWHVHWAFGIACGILMFGLMEFIYTDRRRNAFFNSDDENISDRDGFN